MHGTDVDSWEELEEIIGQIRQDHKDARSSLLFRGQGNSTWPLLTTLERKSGQRFSVREYYALIHRIKDQVQTFTNTQWHVPDHDTLFKLTSEFDEFSRSLRFNGPPAYKHLVHLRHHGFPSPLLDWTSSLYVAAYFAFANPSHQTEKVSIFVYLDEPENYKHWSSGEPTITRLGPYVQTHKSPIHKARSRKLNVRAFCCDAAIMNRYRSSSEYAAKLSSVNRNALPVIAFAYMTDDKKEQAMLLKAAVKEIGRRLKRDLEPDEQTPGRIRELLAQLEKQETGDKK